MQTNSYPGASDSEANEGPKGQKKKKARIPEVAHNINVNFCKNPNCDNFGIPVEERAQRGPGAINRYIMVGSGQRLALCNCCKEHFPIKNNNGVFEESWRICGETFGEPSCPVQKCQYHRVGISTQKAYYSFGLTRAGSQRYRCRCCGKLFSVKPSGLNPIARHRQSDKNLLILELLVNKMPLRRICEVAGVAPRVLYERIDFFYEQALAFMADRESKLPEMKIKRLYIGVDRQEYAINWTRRQDKKNTILTAVASADNATGYVFGMHPNFDPEVDSIWVEQESIAINDCLVPAPFRKFSRLWLQSDYDASVQESIKNKGAGSLVGAIAHTYETTAKREDIEASDVILKDERLPNRGMLVHSEYTLYGHFMRLERLFKNVEKVRFFLDQDSGMRAACLGTFAKRIIDRTVDAFYVSVTKEQTVDEKRYKVGEARKRYNAIAEANPLLSATQVKLLMLKSEIQVAKQLGHWKDKWVMHPLPTISESEKASCFLTDRGDYDDDHLAWLHNKASLHAVDSWFNRLRRRCAMLERSIGSSSNRGRTWYGYAAYRPEQIAKLLTIFRACHNYIWLPSDLTKKAKKETPAMKLGLAKAPLNCSGVVYFRVYATPALMPVN